MHAAASSCYARWRSQPLALEFPKPSEPARAQLEQYAGMARRQPTLGAASRHAGVFAVTCALHAGALYWAVTQGGVHRTSLWTTLQVTFVPAPKQAEPPPPPIPVLMKEAFSQRPRLQIPLPTLELAVPAEPRRAIHMPPPDPLAPRGAAVQEGEGVGPFKRPRALSGPSSGDRYPNESVRRGESGRTVINICIAADGAVDEVEVAESSGYPRLDQAAVGIGWDYVFAPATRGGKPVRVCLPYGITFRIGSKGGAHHRGGR